jgi:hypothetical protein
MNKFTTFAASKISGFAYSNRVLTLHTEQLDETIKILQPQFVYCGKPIDGKNIQHKLEVAIGYEVKTQKLPNVRRMKVVLGTGESVQQLPDVETSGEFLDELAVLIQHVLDAEAAEKPAAKTEDKTEEKTVTAAVQDVEPQVDSPEDEKEVAQAAEQTVVTVEVVKRQAPQRDSRGRFIKQC